jgi:hypothetical protein
MTVPMKLLHLNWYERDLTLKQGTSREQWNRGSWSTSEHHDKNHQHCTQMDDVDVLGAVE